MMDILDGSLLETEKAKLKTVLENGGTVAFIAVSCSPCQDRLDSYESFIAEVGGGDLSISSGSSPTADMIVQSNFRQPNNITEAYFKWSRYVSNIGNGTAIVKADNSSGEVTSAIWSDQALDTA